jgi:methylated-DNA-[protein]-cysteine S-methyltransferase
MLWPQASEVLTMTTFTFHLERVPTAIGVMLILTDPKGRLRVLDWDDHEPRMQRILRLHYGIDGVRLADRRTASEARRSLEQYFAGDLAAIDRLRVETAGTTFQRDVWAALRRIPPGHAISYGEVASRVERRSAVRAVGLAIGANPIGIVVPCHRVIGANGSLTGYGGGLERKRWLLEHEGVRFRHEKDLAGSRDRVFRGGLRSLDQHPQS